MGYLPSGQADIGPEGGLLAPSYKQYAAEGAPKPLIVSSEVYDLGAIPESVKKIGIFAGIALGVWFLFKGFK